jgi:hypothetical protein
MSSASIASMIASSVTSLPAYSSRVASLAVVAGLELEEDVLVLFEIAFEERSTEVAMEGVSVLLEAGVLTSDAQNSASILSKLSSVCAVTTPTCVCLTFRIFFGILNRFAVP